jgi:hypothetical protein
VAFSSSSAVLGELAEGGDLAAEDRQHRAPARSASRSNT